MEIRPMLASNGNLDVLKKDGYIFEPKMDGIRAICLKDRKIKFISRNGIDITEKYPEFDFLNSIKAKNCVLDGEIVVYDKKGNPSFKLWQERNKSKNTIEDHLLATYVVFDILHLNGKNMMDEPLIKRKSMLNKIIKNDERLQTSFYTEKGNDLWKIVKKRHLEGTIAKKKNSTYHLGTRSESWVKIKVDKTTECIILGYTTEKRAITSLALGVYYKNKLIFAGKVGTGFSEEKIKDLKQKLEKIRIKKSEVELPDDVYPVKPKFAAEIKYHDVTNDKKFRAPVFLRLREDKKIEDCRI